MKTLVVGNSLDVLPVIEGIFSRNQNEEVVFFATEGILPYDRLQLPDIIAEPMAEQHLARTAEAFFAQYPVEVVTGEALARLSVKRRYLTTEKKTQINYDHLVLVDTGCLILPEIRGHHRKGVFDCWRFSSVKDMKKYLPFVGEVMVSASRPQGLNVACALSRLKKEVTVISSKSGLLPEFFDDETGLLLKQILETKNIRVISDSSIGEILGEEQVRAVKLKSGKVIACDAVILDEARADIRMLSEPTLSDGDEIRIEECFKPPVMPFTPVEFGLDVFDGFYTGWTKLPEGGREYLKFDGPQNVYKKIYAHGDSLVGAVVFNSPGDNERLLGIIQRQDNIKGREEEII